MCHRLHLFSSAVKHAVLCKRCACDARCAVQALCVSSTRELGTQKGAVVQQHLFNGGVEAVTCVLCCAGAVRVPDAGAGHPEPERTGQDGALHRHHCCLNSHHAEHGVQVSYKDPHEQCSDIHKSVTENLSVVVKMGCFIGIFAISEATTQRMVSRQACKLHTGSRFTPCAPDPEFGCAGQDAALHQHHCSLNSHHAKHGVQAS